MANNELDLLTDLLGEYSDPEVGLYNLSLSKLQSNGITLKYTDLTLVGDEVFIGNNFFKRNPTISELIQEQCLVIFEVNYQRRPIFEPILLASETYEIKLQSGLTTHTLEAKTFKDLTARIDSAGKPIRDNFLLSLPESFQDELLQQKTLYITIKLINIDINTRQRLEKTWSLNNNSFILAQNIYKKMVNDLTLELCSKKINRLELFNCTLKQFHNNLQKAKNHLLEQPFDFWGIRDLIQIQDLAHRFTQKEISNKDLLKTSASCLLKIQNIKQLKSSLILNMPFQSLSYQKLII